MPSPVHPYSDYGVALRTLKSARSWLGLLMFMCVLGQFLGFSLMWWTPQPYEQMKARAATRPAMVSATMVAPADDLSPDSEQNPYLNVRSQWNKTYMMLVPVTQLSTLIAVSSQAIIIFVTLLIVLIAGAPGIAQMTRGFIWSVLLLFMFLPWQYFAPAFPIPGVIYSYDELAKRIAPVLVGEHVQAYQVLLVYGRFLVWPVVGLLVLLITSERYRAGVMIAIGHPLQSILQPRGGGLSPAGGPKPRPLAPLSAGEKPIL